MKVLITQVKNQPFPNPFLQVTTTLTLLAYSLLHLGHIILLTMGTVRYLGNQIFYGEIAEITYNNITLYLNSLSQFMQTSVCC